MKAAGGQGRVVTNCRSAVLAFRSGLILEEVFVAGVVSCLICRQNVPVHILAKECPTQDFLPFRFRHNQELAFL